MKSLEATLPISVDAPAVEPVIRREGEKPVFAATSDARPRALRLFGRVAAGLVGLWLVALVLGAFGLGQIAGIQLPQIRGGDSKPAEKSQPVVREHRAQAPSAASIAASRGLPGRRLSSQPAGSGHRGSGHRTGGGSHSGTHTGGGSSSGGSTHTGGGNAGGGSTTLTPLGTPVQSSPGSSSTSSGHGGTSQGTTAPSSSPSPQASPNATPPGSSSSDPGSRSQSGTAPGRDHSNASPTPGAGSTDTHGRPTS